MPASRKLSKTGRHYAATTHIFRNIIDNLEPHLKWQFDKQFHRKPYDTLNEHSCYCELIGPEGLLIHDSVRIGLLLILPQTELPAHYQAASQSLVILSGNAAISQGLDTPTLCDAGTILFTPSLEAHSLRTLALPMLAVYAWTGEIYQPATLA